MIDIKDGTIKVRCHYGVKMGRPNYSSEETAMSVEFAFMMDGTDGELLQMASQLEDAVMQSLKIGVTTELGVTTHINDLGTVTPNFERIAAATPPVTPNVTPGYPPPQAAIAPQAPAPGGGEFGPPKATKEQIAVLPRFQADFGSGMQTWIDQRPLKKTAQNPDAPYSAKAPDFKNALDSNDSHWLVNNRGAPNLQVQAGLQAAQAVTVDPAIAPF